MCRHKVSATDYNIPDASPTPATCRRPAGAKPKWRPVHDVESLLLKPPKPQPQQRAQSHVGGCART